MRKPFALTLVGASIAALAAATASPALACTVGDVTCGTTQVAFTVASGTIAIATTPAAVGVANTALAPVSTFSGGSTTVTVPLGVTTVTDLRVASTGWTMSAAAPDFALTTDATKTVAKTNAAFYVPAAPTASGATGAPVLSTFSAQSSSPKAVDSGGSASILTSNSTGPNAAVFTPYLQVTIPGGTPTGLYTGTVTQSVA